ncbi:ATP-binding protein [Mycobacterium sp. 852002-51961_SCH5331710]|uniref:ATP-binding protein n=1 Tax=Mycobacterium sp. 852002-51961_SCH5331710 TaxID=1834105 RepID=UPI0007FF31A6|nr:ATP-binding protein [Mycobacterium sp. 852002-51961_SCH5331710]OBB45607.1 anti-sigma regulatory factor [Mycobacterium sp. 852002-51961_SCH5331710]
MMQNPAAVVEMATGPETLAALQETLDQVWSAHDVPDATRMSMDLAVGEIGANIIEHAGGGKSVRLRMEVTVSPTEVTATLIDDGGPSPVDLSQVELPDELAESGRGLAITLRVLDELSYRREETGNRWTLVSRLH